MSRTRKYTLLLSNEEAAMLQSIAEYLGMSAAAWLRLKIRERAIQQAKYRVLQGAKK